MGGRCFHRSRMMDRQTDMRDVLTEDQVDFTARVLPGDVTFSVPPGLSLLEAAMLDGVALPNSCRNGTCRACASRLRGGTIRYRIEWPGLSLDEKDEGWILPCVACAV